MPMSEILRFKYGPIPSVATFGNARSPGRRHTGSLYYLEMKELTKCFLEVRCWEEERIPAGGRGRLGGRSLSLNPAAPPSVGWGLSPKPGWCERGWQLFALCLPGINSAAWPFSETLLVFP